MNLMCDHFRCLDNQTCSSLLDSGCSECPKVRDNVDQCFACRRLLDCPPSFQKKFYREWRSWYQNIGGAFDGSH